MSPNAYTAAVSFCSRNWGICLHKSTTVSFFCLIDGGMGV
jgi:hypothetical protein